MDKRSLSLKQSEVASSVPFQALLYYNFIYALVYYPLTFALLYYKILNHTYESVVEEVTEPACFGFAFLADCFRLWFGYSGNLLEKVPHMTGFMIVTILPQLPAIVGMTFIGAHVYPLNRVAGILMLSLLVGEVIFGYQALRNLINRQTASFVRMCQNEQKKER